MSTQLDAQFTANESNQLTAEELFQSQGLFILPTLPTHMSSTPAADPKRPRSDLRRDILGLPGGGKGTFGQAGIGRNVNGRMLELWRREKHVHATGSGSFLLPSALPFMSQTGTCAGPSDFFSPHLKGHAWDGIGGSAIALGPKKKKEDRAFSQNETPFGMFPISANRFPDKGKGPSYHRSLDKIPQHWQTIYTLPTLTSEDTKSGFREARTAAGTLPHSKRGQACG